MSRPSTLSPLVAPMLASTPYACPGCGCPAAMAPGYDSPLLP
jgi:hypothetical protein